MAILKSKGLKGKKIHFTKKYVRVRVENPKKFQKKSFRIKDIGRKGYTKLVIGKPKGKKTTKVQAVLLKRDDYGI